MHNNGNFIKPSNLSHNISDIFGKELESGDHVKLVCAKKGRRILNMTRKTNFIISTPIIGQNMVTYILCN